MVMAPSALELVQKAAGMDAKSAATPRSGSKQFRTTEKTWRTNEAARIDQRPMALRMQCLPSTASMRLMKAPLPLFPAQPAQDWRRRARERISALVLISAANRPVCLPSKGYMDDGTTFNVLFCRRVPSCRSRASHRLHAKHAGSIPYDRRRLLTR